VTWVLALTVEEDERLHKEAVNLINNFCSVDGVRHIFSRTYVGESFGSPPRLIKYLCGEFSNAGDMKGPQSSIAIPPTASRRQKILEVLQLVIRFYWLPLQRRAPLHLAPHYETEWLKGIAGTWAPKVERSKRLQKDAKATFRALIGDAAADLQMILSNVQSCSLLKEFLTQLTNALANYKRKPPRIGEVAITKVETTETGGCIVTNSDGTTICKKEERFANYYVPRFERTRSARNSLDLYLVGAKSEKSPSADSKASSMSDRKDSAYPSEKRVDADASLQVRKKCRKSMRGQQFAIPPIQTRSMAAAAREKTKESEQKSKSSEQVATPSAAFASFSDTPSSFALWGQSNILMPNLDALIPDKSPVIPPTPVEIPLTPITEAFLDAMCLLSGADIAPEAIGFSSSSHCSAAPTCESKTVSPAAESKSSSLSKVLSFAPSPSC
jgi:hypothetical protein